MSPTADGSGSIYELELAERKINDRSNGKRSRCCIFIYFLFFWNLLACIYMRVMRKKAPLVATVGAVQ